METTTLGEALARAELGGMIVACRDCNEHLPDDPNAVLRHFIDHHGWQWIMLRPETT